MLFLSVEALCWILQLDIQSTDNTSHGLLHRIMPSWTGPRGLIMSVECVAHSRTRLEQMTYFLNRVRLRDGKETWFWEATTSRSITKNSDQVALLSILPIKLCANFERSRRVSFSVLVYFYILGRHYGTNRCKRWKTWLWVGGCCSCTLLEKRGECYFTNTKKHISWVFLRGITALMVWACSKFWNDYHSSSLSSDSIRWSDFI